MQDINRRAAMGAALAWRSVRRSLLVALVVGSVLNLINQGEQILSSGDIRWWPLMLTYCVPFCVATYGAYGAFLLQKPE